MSLAGVEFDGWIFSKGGELAHLCRHYVKEKFENITEQVNAFLQKGEKEMAVSGQQFIVGLYVLAMLISLLFHKSLHVSAIILEFVSLIWYILTGKDRGVP